MRTGPHQTNWPADKKMLPAIPLPFDEVMGDVLKIKAPERDAPEPENVSIESGKRKKVKVA